MPNERSRWPTGYLRRPGGPPSRSRADRTLSARCSRRGAWRSSGPAARPGSFGARMVAEVGGARRGRAPTWSTRGTTRSTARRCLPALADLPEPVDLVLLAVPDAALEEQLAAAARAGRPFGGHLRQCLSTLPGAACPGCGTRLAAIARARDGAVRRWLHGLRQRRPRRCARSATSSPTRSRRAGRAGDPLRARCSPRCCGPAAASASRSPSPPGRNSSPPPPAYPTTRWTCRRPGCSRWCSRRSGTRRRCGRRWPARRPRTSRSCCSRGRLRRRAGPWWRRTPARWPRPTARWEALADAHGVHRVRDLAELADTLELFCAGRRVRRRAGPRPRGIATVHDSGLERAHAADLAEELGVPFARSGPRTTTGWPARSILAWSRPTRSMCGGPAATPSRCSPSA